MRPKLQKYKVSFTIIECLYRVMNINLKAMFNVTQILSPRFKDGASIVNLSSLAGKRAFPEHALYHLSKAGVDAVCNKTRSFMINIIFIVIFSHDNSLLALLL